MPIWATPVPHPGLPFSLQPGLIVLAQTILGEAEGEPYLGKIAVANVVMNRSRDKRWPGDIAKVCLQPKQFSCFNAGSPRLPKMSNPMLSSTEMVWQDCFTAAAAVFFRFEDDNTKGANHYATIETFPKWAKGETPCSVVGQHKFWRL